MNNNDNELSRPRAEKTALKLGREDAHLIDGENCAEYSSANRPHSNVGWLRKHLIAIRFLEDSASSWSSRLLRSNCSEIPESLSLYDDTSNDFLVSGRAKIGRVQAARREANPRQMRPDSHAPDLSCERPHAFRYRAILQRCSPKDAGSWHDEWKGWERGCRAASCEDLPLGGRLHSSNLRTTDTRKSLKYHRTG